jgi:tRNA pseudouridine55 synthase
MATGLLVLGVERGTRLLGQLALTDKTYLATIRLGVATGTDDAQGETVSVTDTSSVTDDAIAAGIAALTGELLQVPSSVSAIKVDGRRAYQRVRAGETVELAARPVTVAEFAVLDTRREDGVVDLDVRVSCTTGTYVRALARDLGAGLVVEGQCVGGHLTALRRTRVGPFSVADAVDVFATDDGAAVHNRILDAGRAAALAFDTRTADADEATALSYGRSVAAAGIAGVYAILGAGGELIALARDEDGQARPVLVWQSAG